MTGPTELGPAVLGPAVLGPAVLGLASCSPTDFETASSPLADEFAQGPLDAWFDVNTVLGRRGYKYLPASSQLALAAGRRALAALPEGLLAKVPSHRRTCWVASSETAASIHSPMDEVIREDGADLLSPLGAPFFSINLVGGRLSTELVAHGGVTTFTTPGMAGFDALAAAAGSIRRGEADLAVVVVVEVPPPTGEPGRDRAEVGALAMVLGPAGAAEPGCASVRVVRGRWSPATLPDDLDTVTSRLVGDLPPDEEGSQAGPSTLLALSLEAELTLAERAPAYLASCPSVTCGPGSLRPMAALAEAVLALEPRGHRIVLAATPDGYLGGALVRAEDARLAAAPVHMRSVVHD